MPWVEHQGRKSLADKKGICVYVAGVSPYGESGRWEGRGAKAWEQLHGLTPG